MAHEALISGLQVAPSPHEGSLKPFSCAIANGSPDDSTDVEYYGVIFQFHIDGGGVLGQLWARKNGKWMIVSYQPLQQ